MTGSFLKAKLIPWHRAAAQAVGLGCGAALWFAGAAGSPPLGWATKAAWVPLVALAILNVHWHREAERATATTPATGT